MAEGSWWKGARSSCPKTPGLFLEKYGKLLHEFDFFYAYHSQCGLLFLGSLALPPGWFLTLVVAAKRIQENAATRAYFISPREDDREDNNRQDDNRQDHNGAPPTGTYLNRAAATSWHTQAGSPNLVALDYLSQPGRRDTFGTPKLSVLRHKQLEEDFLRVMQILMISEVLAKSSGRKIEGVMRDVEKVLKFSIFFSISRNPVGNFFQARQSK
eukprot:g58259.t1